MRLATTASMTGLAAILTLTAPSMAGDFALQIELGGGRNGNHLGLSIARGDFRPVVQPIVVAPQPERVWVAPVYRDVLDKVWMPTTETRYRDIPVVDAHGRVIEYRREAYTVTSGYWETVTRRELVREGYWQEVGYANAPTCGESQKRYHSGAAIEFERHDRDDRHDRRDRDDRREGRAKPAKILRQAFANAVVTAMQRR